MSGGGLPPYGDHNAGYGYQSSYPENYELLDKTNSKNDDFIVFMDKITLINDDLKEYGQIIDLIDKQQKLLLNVVSEDQEYTTRRQLDSLYAQSKNLQQTLKESIKYVQATAGSDSDKKAQAENAKDRFLKLIQHFREVEANHREANKQQAERQYRIVQPDATQEEVEDAINNASQQQVFSQAILNASRRGEAKTALAEVQARHRELQKLEKTMAELAQLFQDMEELVTEQHQVFEAVDDNITRAQNDIEKGYGQVGVAVEHARGRRKKKLWCTAILLLILIIIVVVIIIEVIHK